MTNFERIQTMTQEELAKKLLVRTVCSCCVHSPIKIKPCPYNCTEGRIEWLNSNCELDINHFDDEEDDVSPDVLMFMMEE